MILSVLPFALAPLTVRRGAGWCAVLTVAVGCSGGEREVTGPPAGPPEGSRSLTVRVGVAPEDAELAGALGWENGIPSAEVHVLRVGTDTWTTLSTDSDGTVEITPVLPGLYRVYAGRRLSEAEAAAIGEPVRAFGDGRTVEVGAGESIDVDLALLADRPGGLVISEISQWIPPVQETGLTQYNEALYFELYNGSDVSVFLDGKTFGVSFRAAESVPTPCAMSASARTDPVGVYTRQVLAFPGSGSDFPILPARRSW